MGYIVLTKTRQYVLEDTGNPKIKLISGGQFHQNEIYLPINFDIGHPFNIRFTKNRCNNGFDSKFIDSEILSIKTTPYVQIARPNVQKSKKVDGAGQFFVMDNAGRDIAKILQGNRAEIECDVCDELGIEESKKQRIFISNTVFNEMEPSQCVVVFQDFDCDDKILMKTLADKIYSYLDNDCICSEPMFIEKSNLRFMSQKYSDKNLGLDDTSKIKNAIKTFIQPRTNTHNTTPIIVNKSTLVNSSFQI